MQAADGWTEAPAGVRGGRRMGPSGHRSLLRGRQGPSPGMSQIPPSLEAVCLSAFSPGDRRFPRLVGLRSAFHVYV